MIQRNIFIIFIMVFFIGCSVEGVVKNTKDEYIDQVIVKIIDENNNTIQTTKTNKDGQYKTIFLPTYKKLKIYAYLGDYNSSEHNFSLSLKNYNAPKVIDMILPLDVSIPPDPGEAGKSTLEGIDSDNDGLRDDIQRYIVLNYKDKTEIQKALIQNAKASQKFLLVNNDEKLAYDITIEEFGAMHCLRTKYPKTDEGFYEFDKTDNDLRSILLNTEQRVKQNSKNNALLSGMMLSDGVVTQNGKSYPPLESFCKE